jgi:hypothetical protein
MHILEFDDELILQIKEEAAILKSMIDEIEDEFEEKVRGIFQTNHGM